MADALECEDRFCGTDDRVVMREEASPVSDEGLSKP